MPWADLVRPARRGPIPRQRISAKSLASYVGAKAKEREATRAPRRSVGVRFMEISREIMKYSAAAGCGAASQAKDEPLCSFVGQPSLAGVPSGDGLQPAFAGCEYSPIARKSRLKGVPRGDPRAKLPAPQLIRMQRWAK